MNRFIGRQDEQKKKSTTSLYFVHLFHAYEIVSLYILLFIFVPHDHFRFLNSCKSIWAVPNTKATTDWINKKNLLFMTILFGPFTCASNIITWLVGPSNIHLLWFKVNLLLEITRQSSKDATRRKSQKET